MGRQPNSTAIQERGPASPPPSTPAAAPPEEKGRKAVKKEETLYESGGERGGRGKVYQQAARLRMN
jgi:hypothetical protein